MLRHPLERIRPSALRGTTVALLGAWALLTALLATLISVSDAKRIAELAAAGSSAQARELLSVWPPSTLQSAAFVLGFDFLYDLVHNNAVAVASIWSASARGGRGLTGARSWAWALWLCTLLNVPENLLFLRVVGGTSSDPWVAVASRITEFRFVVLWSGALFAGVNLALAWRGSRLPDAAQQGHGADGP